MRIIVISFAYNDAASITSCTLTERPVFPLFVRTGHLRAPFNEKQIQHLYPVRYSGHNQLHKMNIYVLKIGIQFIWEETTGNYPSSSQVCSFPYYVNEVEHYQEHSWRAYKCLPFDKGE